MIAYGQEPDALDPFRPRDDDWQPATPAEHRVFYAVLAVAALPWIAAAVALAWRVLA